LSGSSSLRDASCTIHATVQADGTYILADLPRGVYDFAATDQATGAKTKRYSLCVSDPSQPIALDLAF
jgi:hypothetical protein